MTEKRAAGGWDLERLTRGGEWLLEANAGTGKTYNLVSLCLHLVEEQGRGIEQLLVVTFTRAAAAELQQRIGERLRQRLEQIGSSAQQADKAARLRTALERLDEAAICTIDAFYYRLCKEYAFELGLPFDLPPAKANQDNLRRACQAWWPLHQDAGSIEQFARCSISDPDSLASKLGQWRMHCAGELRFQPAQSEEEMLKRMKNRQAKEAKVQEAKVSREEAGLLQQLLSSADDEIRMLERQRINRGSVANFSDFQSLLQEQVCGKGERAQRLQQRLRNRWQAVLVDEAQDNNAAQFAIFCSLFVVAAGGDEKQQNTLIFVGDPKQAIYSFRGGDVYAWEQVRVRLLDDTLPPPLIDNWRSVPAQVGAVNAVFGDAQKLFGAVTQGATPPLFVPSRSAADADPFSLWVDGVCVDGLKMKTLSAPEGMPVDERRRAAAEACSFSIKKLLQQSQAVLVSHQQIRPLRAGDIAVLTRTNRQAELVAEELRRRNIACCLRSTLPVLKTPETFWLLTLMRALEDSAQHRLLRAALATPLLGGLGRDEEEVKAASARFREYGQVWRQQGFFAALMMLLAREQVPQRVLEQNGGARTLTNLLHIAELLAKHEQDYPYPSALLRCMQAMMQGAGVEEHELRLETDENLVQLATVHASKGLEYPLVFLPFLWNEGGNKKLPPMHSRDAKMKPCLDADLQRDTSAKDESKEESKEEAGRLLYVALTRAVSYTEAIWSELDYTAEVKEIVDLAASSDGTLPKAKREKMAKQVAQQLKGEIRALRRRHFVLEQQRKNLPRVLSAEQADAATRSKEESVAVADSGFALPFARKVEQSWRMYSYSSIASPAAATLAHRVAGGLEERVERPDYDGESVATGGDGTEEAVGIFAFPRGAHTGTFFHLALEDMVKHRRMQQLPRELTKLARDGLGTAQLPDSLAPVAAQALYDLVHAVFPDGDYCLADLPVGEHQALLFSELEFEFPLAAGWQRVLADYGFAPSEREGFHPGFMKGFIDLVWCKDGCYYLGDLKSNWLGDDAASYGTAALGVAAVQHGYDLQMALYSLALHRHLSLCLPGYDYEQHFGGGYLLFLRGCKAGESSGIWTFRPTAEQMRALDEGIGSRG